MRFLPLLLAVLPLAAPAAAQELIRPGELVVGELAAGDSARDDGSYYDTRWFHGDPGRTYVVRVAAQFPAYVAAGSHVAPGCITGCRRADESGGLFSVKLEYIPYGSGTFLVRVGSTGRGQTGGYHLVLAEHPDTGARPSAGWMLGTNGTVVTPPTAQPPETPAAPRRREPVMLDRGYPDSSTLEPRRRNAHSEWYDEWQYLGAGGHTLRFTMESGELDTVLRIRLATDTGWKELAYDDDGGEGTNSALTITLPENGMYWIQAAGRGPEARGRYRILATSLGYLAPVSRSLPAARP